MWIDKKEINGKLLALSHKEKMNRFTTAVTYQFATVFGNQLIIAQKIIKTRFENETYGTKRYL